MRELAEALVLARHDRARLSAGYADLLNVEQGYAVQDLVRALLGRKIAGWKVARTPDGEVISAPIFDDAVFQSGDKVPESRMSLGFECELAFRLKERLPPIKGAGYTMADVLPLIEEALAAFELLSCRTEHGFQSPRPLLVADSLGNGGIVLGAPNSNWRDLDFAQLGISLSIAGDLVVEKRGGNPIGNPLQAIVFLANHLAQRGLSWEPGQVVMTGAFAGVHQANVKQRVEACFENFEPVSMIVKTALFKKGMMKMLAGEGAIAIWNGIFEEGRADFYAWHLNEHMPERVGTPGFVRGRRYRAADAETHPEFFTLYETQTFEVTQSVDYLNRLNAPTPWTKRATSHFKTTSRSLTRVIGSFGVGSGGALLTLRFDISDEKSDREKLVLLMMKAAGLPEVTGAHILKGDDEASNAKTTESKDRKDIEQPPRWVVLVEACSIEACGAARAFLSDHSVLRAATGGLYRHEYTRLKTAGAAG